MKPVAWMLTLPDGTHDWILDGNGCEGYIPLYTHQVKEQEPDLYSEDGFPLWTSPQLKQLTDEEIIAIAKENLFHTYIGGWEIASIPFAKAILRKAQEK